MNKFPIYSPVLAILLIVPFVSIAYAQDYNIPDIPNIEDFDIPSQEEIEAMMKTTEISGKYTNSEHGVEVTFPEGWKGTESSFNDQDSGDNVTSVAVMEGGMQANMDSMQKGEFSIIALSIMDKTDEEPPEFEPPAFEEGDEYDFNCTILSSEKTKVNNMNTFKSIIECTGDGTTIKGKAHHFSTNDKWIMLAYTISPSSEFDKDVSKYDSAVSTIKISNSIDFDFEIPEELKDPADSSSEAISNPIDNDDNTEPEIPGWIKNNAEWWAAEQIDDEAFIQRIQFLVENGIIALPDNITTNSQEDTNGDIPPWIKSNAEWWSQDLISDKDFVKGIQFLVENGIIIV